jgi:lipoprotein-releasing system permease protein
MMKGVDERFTDVVNLKDHMLDGEYMLTFRGSPTLLMGIAASGTLSFNNPFIAPVQVYVPNPASGPGDSPEQAFFTESVMVAGIFSIDPEIDYTVIAPISFLQDLLGDTLRVSAVEIVLAPGSDYDKVEKDLEELLGADFNIMNRHEQNALLFKIMKSEKLIVFLLLAFILLIASFNILGSLTMLIIEKKQDAAVIRGFGLGISGVRKIFLYQGLMIAFIGAAAGIILGVLFCFLQQEYSIIPMEGVNPGSFIVNAYPVEMRFTDFLIVFATVMLIGYVAARFPVRFITRRFITDK